MGCLSMGMDCPRSSNLVVARWPQAFETLDRGPISLDENGKLLRRTGLQFGIG